MLLLRNATVRPDVVLYKYIDYTNIRLVEMAISTNQKPTIYRNLYENTALSSTISQQE